MKKNVALTGLTFGLVSATDGSAITSGSPAAYITIDGGSQASATNSPVHEGNGQWSLDLTQAEMNGGVIGVLIALAGAVPVQITLITETKVVADLNDIAAGAAMTLTADYDAAKSAAQAGDKMDLVDAPNSTAVTAIQSGLSTHSAADAATAVWAALTSGLTTAGSIGKYLLDHIVGILGTGTHTAQSGDSYARLGAPAGASVSADVAAIKSETASILTDTAEIGTAGAGLTALASSSDLTTVGGQVDTVQSTVEALNDLSSSDVETAVGTALGTYDPPTKAEMDSAFTEIKGATWSDETLVTIQAAAEGATAPSASEVADAVWDEAISGHLTAGTTGAKLNTAGSASDPLENEVPGSYASGTAGYALASIDDIKTKTDLITAGTTVNLSGATAESGDFVVYGGDDYAATESRTLTWGATALWDNFDFAGATIKLLIWRGDTQYDITASVSGSAGAKTASCALTAAQTALLVGYKWQYQLHATLDNGHELTLATGSISVVEAKQPA